MSGHDSFTAMGFRMKKETVCVVLAVIRRICAEGLEDLNWPMAFWCWRGARELAFSICVLAKIEVQSACVCVCVLHSSCQQ